MTRLNTTETYTIIDYDMKFYFIRESESEGLVYGSNKDLVLKNISTEERYSF